MTADVRRSFLTTVAIALTLFSAIALSGCGNKQSPDATTSTSSAQAQPAAVTIGTWTEVTVLGGGAYYGMATAAPAGYVALQTPYYPLVRDDADKGESVKLRSVGAEFHKPDRLLLIPIPSVTIVQSLSEDSSVVKVILEDLGDAKAPDMSADALFDMPTAGVFLTDGRLMFGHAVMRPDGWVSIQGAYYLTRDPEADLNQPVKSLDDLVLVPQNDESVGRSGTLFIAADDVLLIERMSIESPVVKALSTKKP